MVDLAGENRAAESDLLPPLLRHLVRVTPMRGNPPDGVSAQGGPLFWVREDVQLGVVDDEHQLVQHELALDDGAGIHKVDSDMQDLLSCQQTRQLWKPGVEVLHSQGLA